MSINFLEYTADFSKDCRSIDELREGNKAAYDMLVTIADRADDGFGHSLSFFADTVLRYRQEILWILEAVSEDCGDYIQEGDDDDSFIGW